MIKDRYLGDGVYASYDGWHVVLDLRGQGDAHIRIALEPEVFKRLEEFRSDAISTKVSYDDTGHLTEEKD